MTKYFPCNTLQMFTDKVLAIETLLGIPSDSSSTIRLCQAYKNGSNNYLIPIKESDWALVQTILTAGEISSVLSSPVGYTIQAVDANEVVRTVSELIVCDGDSLTYGGTAGLICNRYPNQLGKLLGGDGKLASLKVLNFGVSGQTLANMQSDATSQIDSLLTKGDVNCKRILLSWGGINDLAASGLSTAIANWQAYNAARKLAGWTVVTFTTNFVSSGHATITPQMVTDFNQHIRANYTTVAHHLADIASLPAFSDASQVTTSVYYADTVHPNASGYSLIANYLKPIIESILTN